MLNFILPARSRHAIVVLISRRIRLNLHSFLGLLMLISGLAMPNILSAGELSSLSPMAASAGIKIKINGTGFNAIAANNEVTFSQPSGVATALGSAITSADPNGVRLLTVTVPDGLTPGTAQLSVRNITSGEVSTGRSVEVIALHLPEITSVRQGATNFNVRIQCFGQCRFDSGNAKGQFGSGITVNSTLVESSNSLVSNISISASAVAGSRSIGVLTSTSNALLTGVFSVSAQNAPTADAGKPQTVAPNSFVTLDGRASSDPDRDPLRFQWTLSVRPASSNAVLDNPSGVTPSFFADQPGEYRASLIVNDGVQNSAAAEVVIGAISFNTPPTAHAGINAHIAVGGTAYLDGSRSSDPNGETLNYSWELVSKPTDSNASLSDADTPYPSFTADKTGTYIARLIVNDGGSDSAPSEVAVNAYSTNALPTAVPGADQTVLPGTLVSLDGSASFDTDVDDSIAFYAWSFISKPSGSAAILQNAMTAMPAFTADIAGDYLVELTVTDQHGAKSKGRVVIQARVLNDTDHDGIWDFQDVCPNSILGQAVNSQGCAATQLPSLSVSILAQPAEGSAPLSVNFTSHPIGGSAPYNYSWDFGDSEGSTLPHPNHSYSTPGIYNVLLSLTDSLGSTIVSSLATVNVRGPLTAVFLASPISGSAPLNVSFTTQVAGGKPPYTYAWNFGDNASDGIANPTHTYANVGSYIVNLTVTDAANNVVSTSAKTIQVNDAGNQGALPPDPATVAPPVDPTVATTMASASAFLYSGANPIQQGVAPGTIQVQRAAVLRGKVMTREGAALPGVKITILNHPEFGQTLSRADGMFDLAVNGGGTLTINYQKSAYLSAQRQVNTPWQDYTWAPDVALIPLDSQVTSINLNTSVDVQVARGSAVSDSDGTRQATLLFSPGTTATMILPDGTTAPLNNLNVRATEYTVGSNGPKAMPGPLPPTSGYTYAVELSVDEAIAAGAKRVDFSQPVINYVDNFLNFPIGIEVPSGYYDREKAAWIPSDNGRIIKIMSVANGFAELDTDGSNAPADLEKLSTLGITDAERQKLATIYLPGKSLWRVPVKHFTPWDYNWPFGPPADAEQPKQDGPKQEEKEDDPCERAGSIIECQNQILGERISLTGTPYSLNYRSDRVPARRDILLISLSGISVPQILKRIELEISIAGQQYAYQFPGATNQHFNFQWDGKDAYGRRLQGAAYAHVRLGYVYDGAYERTTRFNVPGSGYKITGSRTRQEVTLWQEFNQALQSWDAIAQGLGGWSLSAHHTYDPVGEVLYLGDGTRRSAQNINQYVVEQITGYGGIDGDGIPANQAYLGWVTGIAFDAEGNTFISESDTVRRRIRKIDTAGIITTIAGGTEYGFSGDGGPAKEALLNAPSSIATDLAGNLYIADSGNGRVRKIDRQGVITTIAGNGGSGFSGDGGPALQASIGPWKLAFDKNGNLYIADSYRIRKVGADGIIQTIAGQDRYAQEWRSGIPASEAFFNRIDDIATDDDGALYIMDAGSAMIRKIGSDGIIRTVVGNGNFFTSSPDGTNALQASLMSAKNVVVTKQGHILFTEIGSGKIRQVSAKGILSTVAGGGEDWRIATSTLARAASLDPRVIRFDPKGDLYITVSFGAMDRVLKISSRLPGIRATDIAIPAEDGTAVYFFNSNGRHERTVHALTGAVLYRFHYDNHNYLTSIEDANGNFTRVERDDITGAPIAILSPDQQRTTLTSDANGYFASLTNPAGEVYRMSYNGGGLLLAFASPNGSQSKMSYDEVGHLIKDENAAGGFLSLIKTASSSGYSVNLASALNRNTTYTIENLVGGTRRHITTLPDGTYNESTTYADGQRISSFSNGVKLTEQIMPDPRFGIVAPVEKSRKITMPSGLAFSKTSERNIELADSSNILSLIRQTDISTLNGRTYTREFNAEHQLFTETSPENRQSKTTVDAQARPIQSEILGVDAVNYIYDTRGRLISTFQGAGAVLRQYTFAYNPQGYLASVSDPLSRTVTYTYDLAGRVTKETLPDGREVQYSYDANGNITSVAPPGRPSHNFGYTAVDLESSYTPPDINNGITTTQYAYNLDKQLISIARPDGQVIPLIYDDGGRLSKITLPRGDINYSYQATTGQLSSIIAPGSLGLSYNYDGDLLLSESWSGAVSGNVTRTYDNNFWLKSISVNGSAINYTYDNDGLLIQAGDMQLTRDPQNGFITQAVLGGIVTNYGYNSFGELISEASNYNGTPIFELSYARDLLGRITNKTETIQGETHSFDYGYDIAGRLTAVQKNGTTIAQYAYDANGNRLSLSNSNGATIGQYDNQDRLTHYGSVTFNYTANGELQSRLAGTSATNFSYDALGNLISAGLSDGVQIDYLVDGHNRRSGKKINGTIVQSFLYEDQLRPIAELDANNNIISRFLYGAKSNVPDYLIKTGMKYRILSDHLGSPRVLVNANDGTIVQRIDYDEFGNVTLDSNPGFQPFGFAGGLLDRDTKLTRFGARDYDAQIGRWTTKDPIRFNGGDTNLYGYVLNDPINFIDPNGLAKKDPLNNRAGPTDQSGRVPRTGDAIEGYNRPEKLGEKIEKRVLDKVLQEITGVGGLVSRSPLAIGIPLLLHSPELGCGTLDCNNNGIPDSEEKGGGRKQEQNCK